MPTPPRNMDLWVLAGQSNMVGRAMLKNALKPNERVWNFASRGEWEIATEPLHRLWESFTPVHADMLRMGIPADQQHLPNEHWAHLEREAPSGAGLGIAFGVAMTQTHGRAIGLIPSAHGGVSLEQWNPAHASKGTHSLYGAMLERIRRARESGTLKGILWYQGENDTLDQKDADSYGRRFTDWIRAVRSDTGIADLPIVIVQIGRMFETGRRYGGIDAVRQALAEIPDHVDATAVTSAIDLNIFDSAHITTSGLIRVGRRLARQALRLTEQPNLPVGPHVVRIEPMIGDTPRQPAIRVVIEGATGRLSPSEGIHGFSIHDDQAETTAPLNIWNSEVVDEKSPASGTASIRLLPSRPVAATMKIAYGLGLTPHCNVVDEVDMPLCAFGPRPISFQQ